jgi:TonB family protein
MIEALSVSPMVRAIALALVDFVWQGAAIGVATAFVLMLSRRAGAGVRYGIACAGLVAMTITPVLTTAAHLRTGSSVPVADASAGEASPSGTVVTDAGAGHVMQLAGAARFREWLEPRLPAVALTWSAGVLMMAAHLLAGWLRIRRLQRTATLLDASRWPAAVRAMACRFRMTRRVRLFVSSIVDVPAVIGCLRPAILVPASALSGLTPAHLEAILLHELAHVRRGDYLVNVLQCVVEVLLFYHPAVWWVSSQIRREREHCCDDVAAALCADRMTYARALISLEELRGPVPRLAPGAAGGDLLARIRRLVEPQRVSSPRISGGFAMGVIVTIALLALGTQAGPVSVQADRPDIALEASSAPAAVPSVVPPAPIEAPPARTNPPRSIRPATPAVRSGSAKGVPTPVEQTQTGQAGLAGTVRDRTGGVLPGVTVALATSASDPARTTTTNARGEFVIDGLTGGTYILTVSLAGFRTARTNIDLTAGNVRRIAVALNIGSVTETVTVQAPATDQRAAPATRTAQPTPQGAGSSSDDVKATLERAGEVLRAMRAMNEASTITDAQPAAAVTGPIRVGGSIKEPRKIKHVSPIYPADALAAGVEGLVVLEAVIATDGTVKDLTVVRSVAMLDGAAADAVRQWLFTPTQLNGAPVEVLITVSVNFARQ